MNLSFISNEFRFYKPPLKSSCIIFSLLSTYLFLLESNTLIMALKTKLIDIFHPQVWRPLSSKRAQWNLPCSQKAAYIILWINIYHTGTGGYGGLGDERFKNQLERIFMAESNIQYFSVSKYVKSTEFDSSWIVVAQSAY